MKRKKVSVADVFLKARCKNTGENKRACQIVFWKKERKRNNICADQTTPMQLLISPFSPARRIIFFPSVSHPLLHFFFEKDPFSFHFGVSCWRTFVAVTKWIKQSEVTKKRLQVKGETCTWTTANEHFPENKSQRIVHYSQFGDMARLRTAVHFLAYVAIKRGFGLIWDPFFQLWTLCSCNLSNILKENVIPLILNAIPFLLYIF